MTTARSIDDRLLQEGVSASTLAKAKERLKDGQDLGEALRELGALNAKTWAKVQATYYGLPEGDFITCASSLVFPLDIQKLFWLA